MGQCGGMFGSLLVSHDILKVARIAYIGPENMVHWLLAVCVLLINSCFSRNLTMLKQKSICLSRYLRTLQTYLVHSVNLERLLPWQDRRHSSVCVLILSVVPCAASSVAKGDQAVIDHCLVLGVDAGL